MTYRKSRLLHCLVLIVYFIFFSVQLHLRYTIFFADIIPVNNNHTELAAIKGQGIEKSNAFHQTKPDVKLNKRYYPTPLYEAVALQFKLQQPVAVIKKQTFSFTPALSCTILTYTLLRGPPCDGQCI
jgi:hypothetical protein